jgi:hypothetical protein
LFGALKEGVRLMRAWLCSLLLIAKAALAQPPDETMAALRVLDAGLDRWRQDVEFYATYKEWAGETESEEQARAGGEGLLVGSGVLVKRGWMVRESFTARKLPDRDPESFDCVATQELDLTYYPDKRDLHVYDRPIEYQKMIRACSHSFMDSPLAHGGAWSARKLQDALGNGEGDARPAECRIERLPQDRVAVRITRYPTKGGEFRYYYQLWITGDGPVIEEWLNETDGPAATYGWGRRGAKGSHFVRVKGGWVARQIHYFGGPYRFLRKDGGETPLMYIWMRWVSEDLGRRPPTEEDFRVPVPANARVFGLKNPPARDPQGRVDLTAIRKEDLTSPSDAEDAETRPQPPAGPWRRRLGFSLGAAAILAAVLFLVVRKRAKGRSNAHGPARA